MNPEYPVVDLTTDAFKNYQAQALCRAGASDVHLLVPATRDRTRPIVVEVETELLEQLLKNRVPGYVPLSYDALRECLDRKSAHLEELSERVRDYDAKLKEEYACSKRQVNRNERLQAQVNDLGDKLTDSDQRLSDLQVAYVERGEELATLRQQLKDARESETSLKRRCEALGDAIRKVLYPKDDAALWKMAHTALKSGLARRGFHTRADHPVWSRHFWVGCSLCVPEWLLYAPEDLSRDQTCPTRDVVAALGSETAAILRPALTGQND